MEQKPIKRRKELVPLSRDHHNGLLLCWKIRTGIRTEIDYTRISQYVLYFFEHDLKEHFRQEEELLFSLLPDTDAMKQDVLQQHARICTLVEEVREKADIPLLEELADTLDAHIRFEERQLFPYIEQTIDPLILEEAGKKIEACTHSAELEWADEFWLKTK